MSVRSLKCHDRTTMCTTTTHQQPTAGMLKQEKSPLPRRLKSTRPPRSSSQKARRKTTTGTCTKTTTATTSTSSHVRLDVMLDQDQVRMGTEVSGYIRIRGDTRNTKVRVLFEGIESTVVAFPNTIDNMMGMDYLRKHTTDRMVFLQQDILLDCAIQQSFRFPIPDKLPGTMKYRVEGSHPVLPSQCQIRYMISAVMFGGNASESETSKEIVIIPKRESDTPVDPFVRVSIQSVFDLFLKAAFSCGDALFYVDQPDIETPLAEEKYILLEPNPSTLYLSAGQPIKVEVYDRLGFLSGPNHVWMVRLIEKLSWKAKGRIEQSRQSWDLFADHHIIPTTVRRTYDHRSDSLIKVEHEAIIYLVRKQSGSSSGGGVGVGGNNQTILATTEPIPTTIVSGSQGLYEA